MMKLFIALQRVPSFEVSIVRKTVSCGLTKNNHFVISMTMIDPEIFALRI